MLRGLRGMRSGTGWCWRDGPKGGAQAGMDGCARVGEAARVQVTETEKALRAHLRSHNQSVLAASGMALVFSAIGWAVLYGASYWLTMFWLTIMNQGEAMMPAAFHAVFFGTAAVLMLAARIDQYFFPSERAVDERPPVEHLADLLFFVPRFTMSCWQNLGALAWLPRCELPDAARLMDALRLGGRVSLQELPTMFPDARRLGRTLDALLVAGLVDQRRERPHLAPSRRARTGCLSRRTGESPRA